MNTTLSETREVIAHNDAVDSGNPMHTDAAARALNFKGALVPGVTVYGYMTHSLVTQFGTDWLERGWIHVRFRRPVYAGERLRIAGTPAADALALDVRNPDDEICVTGRGGLVPPADLRTATGELPRHRPLPQPRWPAEREFLAREQTLGTLTAHFPTETNAAFLDAMQDALPCYRDDLIHPAWLLRQANLIVDRNFAIGPWIHVESDLVNYASAPLSAPLEIRAQVCELFEKKTHSYADLDVAIVLASAPTTVLMRIMHRVIYRMAEAD